MINTIPLSDIVIPENRQRKQTSPAIQDIADSILRDGMFHAIILRPDRKTLVAGETRYKALSTLPSDFQVRYDGELLPPGHVPYTIAQSEDELTLHAIELNENICRSELHWADRAAAIAKLDELRRKQHGNYDPVLNPSGWSVTKTAGEINKDKPDGNKGGYVTQIRQEIDLARAIEANPDLAKIKDKSKAIRELRAIQRREETLAAIPSLFDASSSNIKYTIGDCLQVLTSFPAETFDCVITDPPFGRNFHKHTTHSGQDRNFDDSPEYYSRLMEELIPLLDRVTKPQAHLYLFCDLFHWDLLCLRLELHGFSVWRYPILWDKGIYGSFANIEYGPRHSYETILFANKGKREVICHEYDVIRNIAPVMERIHPDEKPPELWSNLLARSVLPGDQVLDCFAGSGSIIPALNWKGAHGHLIEQDPQWESSIVRYLTENNNA